MTFVSPFFGRTVSVLLAGNLTGGVLGRVRAKGADVFLCFVVADVTFGLTGFLKSEVSPLVELW